MSGTILLILVAVVFLNDCVGSNISDKRLCFDPKCSAPISLATGLVKYVGNYDEMLSFQPGDTLTIFSKSAGSKPDLWGAEIAGKRGYVPKHLIKEIEIFHPIEKLKYTVSTQASNEPESTEEGSSETIPDKEDGKINGSPTVTQSSSKLYDVIDGTTIYSDSLTAVTPTASSFSTNSKEMKQIPVESTASFISTTGDINSQNSIHSEMSPISATTMMEKRETTETGIDTSESNSEPESGNIAKSMMKFVSDLVADRSEGDFESATVPKSEIHDDKKDLITEESVDEEASLGKSNKISSGDDFTGRETKNRGSDHLDEGNLKEKSVEDDDEEDGEDEEDEEDEDEEEEEEEEDNFDEEGDREIRRENSIHEGSKASIVNESLSDTVRELEETADTVESEGENVGTKTQDEENKYLEVTGTAFSRLTEQSKLESLNETGSGHENIFSVSSDSELYSSDLQKSNVVESADAVSLNPPSPSQSKTMDNNGEVVMPADRDNEEFQLSLTGKQVDNTFYADSPELKPIDHIIHHTINTIASKIQFPEKKDVSEFLDKNDLQTGHVHNKLQSGPSELQESGGDIGFKIDSPKSDDDKLHKTMPESMLFVSAPSDSEANMPSIVSEDQLSDTLESSPSSTTPVSIFEHSTTDPISDDIFSKPDNKEINPFYTLHQEVSKEENVDFVKDENLPPAANQIPNTEGEGAEVEIPGKSNQHEETVVETPNVSDSQDQLPVPEESSGIFSMVLGQFSSGYGFVADLVFGKKEEDEKLIEIGETAELSDKSYDYDSMLKQPIEDEDGQTPAIGDSFFGSSPNSHCEADHRDPHCTNLYANSPSVSETSSDVKDQSSGEDEESTNWFEFLNFSAGDKYGSLFDIHNSSYGAIMYSIITGVLVLCFFLGYYFIEGNRRDVLLLGKINSLEKELTVSSKECLILREKLKMSLRKSSNFDDSSEVINSLKDELEKVQNEKAQLERELEATTEAGLEMELMVSQFLSSQHDSKSLMESIEQLQKQANQQQTKISTLENSLISKTQENETLAQELSLTEQKVQELEEDLRKVSANLMEKDEYFLKYNELEKLSEIQQRRYEEDLKNKMIEAEMALTRCKSLESSLTESKDTLAVKENEISVLQDCLQKLKISNGEDPDKAAVQLKDMLDFGKLKAELVAVAKERDTLKEELQGEEEARKLLEDHVKVIREEVEKLRKCHEAAEREKVEAQTRLEVLSSYFKEKETQLQKELGIQEAMWVQKNTDASTIMQHMKSLEEEVENYRKEQNISKLEVVESTSDKPREENNGGTPKISGSQNETLKKEILDQERGYKTQLATFEKKAHENWVAARQAERKLEESKQESSLLRNRLTMIDKTNPNSVSQNGDDSKPNPSVMDSNGELSASPLHLGLASNSSVDMLHSESHPLFLDPNSSPPHVGGGGRLPPPPLLPPFPPLLPLPPRSPYHHPLSPPLPPFMPLPPPDYPSSIDGHRPPPLGRMSSPPPSPSRSPRLPSAESSRAGEYPSPYRDRGGGGRSSSPPPGMFRGMSLDNRGLVDEWGVGRYRTPPPHSAHPPEFPPLLYPHPQPHWEDEPPPPTSSFRPLPSQVDPLREHKGGRPKGSHQNESDMLDKANRHGGKL